MSQSTPPSPSSESSTSSSTDALFENWIQQEENEEEDFLPSRRFSTGRSPLVLWAVFGLSLFLAYSTWPAMEALIEINEYEECGTVYGRLEKKRQGQKVHPFTHLTRCELSGMVQNLSLFAIGNRRDPENKDPYLRNLGMNYVAKLNGDQVYAILPAHQKWVEAYRKEKGSLFGLEFKTKGLMIQPKQEPTYQKLEKTIRLKMGVDDTQELWFFDVSYSPWDHKIPLITFGLSPLIALASLWALWSLRRRKMLLEQLENEEGELYEAFLARLQQEEAEDAILGKAEDFPDFDPQDDDLDWDQINAPITQHSITESDNQSETDSETGSN